MLQEHPPSKHIHSLAPPRNAAQLLSQVLATMCSGGECPLVLTLQQVLVELRASSARVHCRADDPWPAFAVAANQIESGEVSDTISVDVSDDSGVLARLTVERRRGRFRRTDQVLLEQLGAYAGPLVRAAAETQARMEEGRPAWLPDSVAGRSFAMRGMLKHIEACADLNVGVLITGPTGAGKSHAARLIHQRSGLSGPFVAINCAHLTAERALVDLFGACAGAYTGLNSDRPGLIEQARGGTLFLDEVTELPASVQAQVLQVLQDRSWRRVGENRLREAAGVRIIAATNDDPETLMRAGALRPDLFHRLAQFRIHIPGLSERSEDVEDIAQFLAVRLADELGLEPIPLGAGAIAALEMREWPGNIRALENAVRQGLIWARAFGSPVVRAVHLDPVQDDSEDCSPMSLKVAASRFKERYAATTLAECGGNRAQAARQLGIHRSHLYEILNQDAA